MTRLGWLGVLMLGAGCVSARSVRGYPLYGAEHHTRAEVAMLVGDVAEVDGESVTAHGHRFELLPGCHVVTTIKDWSGADHNGAAIAHLPAVPFAMDMKPGFTYVVQIGVKGQLRENFRVGITAEEQDAGGKVLRQFKPGYSC